MQSNYNIETPACAKRALAILEAAGFEAWLVGGFVRDALMGRKTHDIDMAVSCTWQETKAIFEAAGMQVYETGAEHGTVTVMINGYAIEMTTYRTEGIYSDGRHPDSVAQAATIEEDLARRDFTMNAIAYHPARGLIDPYGGRADIDAKLIRTVGTAAERFCEDALRILRACRFASQLGFSIEEKTLQAAKASKTMLIHIAKERMTRELEGLLLGEYVHDALMETSLILTYTMPEIAGMVGFDQRSPYHQYDVFEHSAYAVQNTPAYPLVRWAAFLHDSGKPAAFFTTDGQGHFYGHARLSITIAGDILNRLAFPARFIDEVLTLIKFHDTRIEATPRGVKQALRYLDGNVEVFRALCELQRADALSKAERYQSQAQHAELLLAVLDEVLATNAVFSRKKLAIDGHNVMALGVEPGPRVGALLDAALDAVIDERVANTREELLAYLRGILDEARDE